MCVVATPTFPPPTNSVCSGVRLTPPVFATPRMQDEHVKITDFGFATTRMNSASQRQARLVPPSVMPVSPRPCRADCNTVSVQVGTAAFMAPEIISGAAASGQDNKKGDVYAFAVVMWELGAWGIPYHLYLNQYHICTKVVDGSRPDLEADHLRAMPPTFTELMQRCWAQTCAAPSHPCPRLLSA